MTESQQGRDVQRATAARNVEAILDATLELLRRGEQANFSAVAAESGLSRPTVYAHFSNRELLLEALVERAIRDATGAFASAEVEAGTGHEALERLLTSGWRDIARHDEVIHVAASSLSPHALHRAHASARERLVDIFERGKADGSFRDDLPTPWMVATCLGIIQAASHEVRYGTMSAKDAGSLLARTVISAVS